MTAAVGLVRLTIRQPNGEHTTVLTSLEAADAVGQAIRDGTPGCYPMYTEDGAESGEFYIFPRVPQS
jgi:D-hexose-6-phosphate mutarotase